MPKITSGKRYAKAVFELALERNELEGWHEGLEKIAESTRDEELMALLENPKLSFPAKKSLLEKRLGKINPLAFNLILLLISRGLFRLADDISRQYHVLWDAHRGMEHVEVTTALPLSDQDEGVISQRIGKVVGRRIVMDARVDPSMIGGFIARMGDMLIDGSIRQRLETFKKDLIEVNR